MHERVIATDMKLDIATQTIVEHNLRNPGKVLSGQEE